ncbi:MAG: LysM peptidoglycan-binding domain-containing protein [Planctomycetota bacterium]|nr:MAG: LysM peptidoglycan-binding domain-containing protein [Planctomycetota bacterium]
MVLSSQSIRSDGRRMMSSDGRRIRRRGWKLFALAGLVIVFGWIGWRFFGSQSEIPASEIRHENAGEIVDNAAPETLTEAPVETIQTAIAATPKTNSVMANANQNPPVIGDAKLATPPKPTATNVVAAPNTNENQTQSAQQTAAETTQSLSTPQEIAASNESLQAALAQVDTDPVAARESLTRILDNSATTATDRLGAYEAINKVNAVLTFSERVLANDPFSKQYTVQEGDSLSNIRKSLHLDCEWRFLQRINHLATERSIRVGQVLKTPTGAFHGEVHKSEFRLNIFQGDGPGRVMIASYPISLGEFNSTPIGAFSIRPRSKLIDPEWRNPRTGQHFASNDPANPIGERWIGLKGIEPHNKNFEGYGIHGTTDITSIGKQASMGCVRMLPQDVEVVYELLTEPNSVITIAP